MLNDTHFHFYNIHMMFKYNKTFGTMIDIGINELDETIDYAKMFDKVIAFEANPYQINKIKNHNLFTNNIELYNIALGDINEIKEFNVVTDNTGYSTFYPDKFASNYKNFESIPLPIRPLDEIINEPVDLIKIDAEGSDTNILFGAEKLLKKYKPIIAVEWLEPEGFAYLNNLGYILEASLCPGDVPNRESEHFFVHMVDK